MKTIPLLSILLLAACTSSHYVQAPGNTASQAQLDSDLAVCKSAAFKKYNDAHANDDHSGAIIGGVIGGGIGALIGSAAVGGAGGAVVGSANHPPKIDLNAEIENCMADKGYSGVSKGYN